MLPHLQNNHGQVEGGMFLQNAGTPVPDYTVITQKTTTKSHYQNNPTFHMQYNRHMSMHFISFHPRRIELCVKLTLILQIHSDNRQHNLYSKCSHSELQLLTYDKLFTVSPEFADTIHSHNRTVNHNNTTQ
jgi:hypothetical protein